MNKKKAIYGFAMILFASASLGVFILASSEQLLLSTGSPNAEKIRLPELTAQRSSTNNHIELSGFYFGTKYVYGAELVQFNEVYLPIFLIGEPEDGSHLQVLVWIRNDRNSNERFIGSRKDLDDFVSKYNRAPRAVSGVLQKPTSEIRQLTAEAYPGVKSEALQVLWARDFPSRRSTAYLWDLWLACLIVMVVFGVAFRRLSRAPRAIAAES